jgi:hypothetical protein
VAARRLQAHEPLKRIARDVENLRDVDAPTPFAAARFTTWFVPATSSVRLPALAAPRAPHPGAMRA